LQLSETLSTLLKSDDSDDNHNDYDDNDIVGKDIN